MLTPNMRDALLSKQRTGGKNDFGTWRQMKKILKWDISEQMTGQQELPISPVFLLFEYSLSSNFLFPEKYPFLRLTF